MSTLTEIEEAIEQLPVQQVEELAAWLGQRLPHKTARPRVEDWIGRARGAARAGVTTDDVMALTRGEE
jgi:hypothetical protein